MSGDKDIASFLKQAHDDALEYMKGLSFDKKHKLHLHVILLYCSIVELTKSLIVLLDNALGAGVPILVRSLMEAYIDLVNLIKNPKYGYGLEIKYCSEWLKVLEDAKRERNPFLKDISNLENLEKTITEVSERQKQLEKEYKAPRVIDRFESAGMKDEYRSIYNFLCCHSHNDFRSLIDRHVEIKGDDASVVLFKTQDSQEMLEYVILTCELLIFATEKVHEFFKSDVMPKVGELRKSLDEFRLQFKS